MVLSALGSRVMNTSRRFLIAGHSGFAKMSNNSLDTIEKNIKVAQRVAVFLIVSVPLIYALWFGVFNNRVVSVEPGDWGTFGDFVGGLLNPVIAFFAFYWLTKSVQFQKEELFETRKALLESKDAQKEQAKYQLISAHLSALDTRLTVLQSDIENTRNIIEYYVKNGKGTAFGFTGDYVNSEDELSKSTVALSHFLDERKELQKEITSALHQINESGT